MAARHELVRRRGCAEADRLTKISEALCQRILTGSTGDGFMLIDISDMLRASAQVNAGARTRLATHFAALAATSAENGDLRLSRHLERKAQQWFASVDDLPSENESVERVARLYEREADERLANGADGSAMAAGIFLEKAIGRLRARRPGRRLGGRTPGLPRCTCLSGWRPVARRCCGTFGEATGSCVVMADPEGNEFCLG